MSEIAVQLDFNSSPDTVWKKLAEFGGLEAWAPGVESCKVEGSGVGAVRHVGMPGGAVMEERLETLDDANRTLQYSIVGGPMPVKDYLATVKVSETEGGCRVDWGASFTPPEGVPAEAMAGGIEGAYAGMLEALKKHLGE